MISKKKLLITALALFLIFLYFSFIWGSYNNFNNSIDHCEKPFCDFMNHYFPMGQEIFTSNEPAPYFFYGIPFALFLGFFQGFELTTALLFWGFIQATFIIILFLMPILLIKDLKDAHYTLYVLLFLTSFPILHNFKWGQVSTMIVALILASFLLYKKGLKSIAAIVLAIPISIKFYPAIFLFFFLIKKEYKFVLTSLITLFTLLILIPTLFIGYNETYNFNLEIKESIESFEHTATHDINSQSVIGVFNKTSLSNINFIHKIISLASYIFTIINLASIYLIHKLKIKNSTLWSTMILFTITPFFVFTSWPHYFVFLPFCQLTLYKFINEEEKSKISKIIKLSLLLLPSVIMSNIILFNWINNWNLFSEVSFIFISNLLILILIHTQIIPKIMPKLKETINQKIKIIQK